MSKPKKKLSVKKQKISAQPKQPLIPLLLVLGCTFLVLANTLNNGFVNWDDPVNLTENPHLEAFTWNNIKDIFTTTVIGNYNPLPIFTFAIEKAIFGLDPFIFHFNNLLLHLLCVFFIYRILLEMRLGIYAAVLGALLFGIHPMRVESVAWITERKDVLFAAFYFAAIYTWILHLKKPEEKKWYLVTLVLFIPSLFSKIQAVALPLSLLAVDYFYQRPLKLKLIIEKIPFFLLSLVIGVLGIYLLGKEGSLDDETKYTLVERILVGTYTYVIYILKWIFPYRMSPLYPYTPEIPTMAYVTPFVLLSVVGAGVWAFIKSKREIVFAIAFFTFNVMFVLQVVGAGQGYLADRFTYVAYFGLFFLTAWFYEWLIKKFPYGKNYINTAFAAYLVVLVFYTFQQTKVWKNGETLWSHVLEYFPNANTPYQNRGKYYQSIGNNEKAKDDFTRAIAVGGKIDISYNSRGKIYFDEGKMDLALSDFNAAVNHGTKIGEIYINRGAALASQQRFEEALKDFNEGLSLDPDNNQGYLMRSLLFFTRGDFEKALSDYDRVLKDEPENADVWYESGLALKSMKRYDEALARFDKAISLKKVGVYYLERSEAHRLLGHTDQAEQDAQMAKSLGAGHQGR